MDPRRLRLSLLAVEIVGAATLLRSVAYDRWITVLASLLLVTGAIAARRGRAWGIALTLASAAAFPVACAIGIAPAWFCLVGVAGALPFVIASRAFARFDRGATALLAILAAAAGTLGALAWKEVAWSLFTMFPSLRPSYEAQHAIALTAIVGAAVVAAYVVRRPRGERSEDAVRTRIETGSRVEIEGDHEAEAAQEDDRAEPLHAARVRPYE
jgi:hypothetical protein